MFNHPNIHNPTFPLPQQFQQSSTFSIPQHSNQAVELSPGGDGSSNRTPSEADNVGIELFPDETKDKSSKLKWCIKEDEALVSAYLLAGGDEKKGTNQVKGDFWKNLMRMYEDAREEAPNVIQKRTMKSLTSRWEIINRDVSRWVGVYAQARRDKRSGQSEEDVETEAHSLYRNKYNGNKFTLMHAWNEMKHKRKWQAEIMINLRSNSEDSSKRSQPDTPTDEECGRPDGIKKAKKKGKQVANSSGVNIDVFTNAISEMNVCNSKREQVGIQMLEYQKQRDAAKLKQKEEDKQWQLFMLLLGKSSLDPDEKVMLAKLKEKFNYMFN